MEASLFHLPILLFALPPTMKPSSCPLTVQPSVTTNSRNPDAHFLTAVCLFSLMPALSQPVETSWPAVYFTALCQECVWGVCTHQKSPVKLSRITFGFLTQGGGGGRISLCDKGNLGLDFKWKKSSACVCV